VPRKSNIGKKISALSAMWLKHEYRIKKPRAGRLKIPRGDGKRRGLFVTERQPSCASKKWPELDLGVCSVPTQ
jgi:hypothetical protein